MLKSIELRASRNMGIDHQQVQSLMAIDLVDCRNQHSLGINAHHLSRRQVHDCNRGLANQKGGTAKTTTCANLGIGLAQAGRKVLLVDADAQGSLTLSLGWEPDELPITLYDLMIKAIQDRPVIHGEGMLHHEEGVDLLPANIELAGIRR